MLKKKNNRKNRRMIYNIEIIMKNKTFLLIFLIFLIAVITYQNINKSNNKEMLIEPENILGDTSSTINSDIDKYYNSIKKKHKLKVSITTETLSNFKSIYNKNNMISNISNGYNSIQTKTNGLFKTSGVISANCNKCIGNTCNICTYDQKYYKYNVVSLQNTSGKDFKSNADDVKERVENLILLHYMTGDEKYLTAIKLEILSASQWNNNWIPSTFISISPISYAVSLGYDYTFNYLTNSEKCIIENRLLWALILSIGKDFSNSVSSKSNYNTVTNSSLGEKLYFKKTL